MRKQLKSYLREMYLRHHWHCVSPAAVFACTFAASMTAFFYWLYFQLFLFLHDLFPARSSFDLLAEEWRDQWTVTIRLAFELLALGVLWRYLTPNKVYRYWQAGINQLHGPFPQTWKQLATMVLGLCLLFGALIGGLGFYHYKFNKPAQQTQLSGDDLTRKALIKSSPARPCYGDAELFTHH